MEIVEIVEMWRERFRRGKTNPEVGVIDGVGRCAGKPPRGAGIIAVSIVGDKKRVILVQNKSGKQTGFKETRI